MWNDEAAFFCLLEEDENKWQDIHNVEASGSVRGWINELDVCVGVGAGAVPES